MGKRTKGDALAYSFWSHKNYSDVLNPILALGNSRSQALKKIFDVGYCVLKAHKAQSEPSLFDTKPQETSETKKGRTVKALIPQNSCRFFVSERGNPTYLSFPSDFARELENQGYKRWDIQESTHEIYVILSKEDAERGRAIYFNRKRGGEMRLQDHRNVLSKLLGAPTREGEIWAIKQALYLPKELLIRIEKQ